MNLANYQAKKPFAQQHLLTLQDYSAYEILQILSLAIQLKADLKEKGGYASGKGPCNGQTLAMIFTKSSTRTRVSFETGFYQLGGQAMFLSTQDIQLGRGEPIEDTAKVLGRMVDGIMIRTFAHSDAEALAQYSGIPVINGLTDDYHPCQALADLLTYYEHLGHLSGKLAYIGDGNNVAHSLMIACSKLGIDIAIATPKGYEPAASVIQKAESNAAISGSKVIITQDPHEAAKDANCLYTDVWASMGQETEQQQRISDFAGYQITPELMQLAAPDAIFQHCLPAHRGEEVSAAVIDGPQSVVFDEAENRLHVQKAVIVALMGKETSL